MKPMDEEIIKILKQQGISPYSNRIRAFKNVWNLAIEKAAEEANIDFGDLVVDKESILKLKY